MMKSILMMNILRMTNQKAEVFRANQVLAAWRPIINLLGKRLKFCETTQMNSSKMKN